MRPLLRGCACAAVALGLLMGVLPLLSHATNVPQLLGLTSGAQIWQAACAACHGSDGAGTPQYLAGFDQPDTFPHFNKCDESEPEYTRDWTAVIRDGGPARGFSRIMPAFGSALTPQQIDTVARYVRSLCTDRAWPPGELNVPRALVTEKAFPESEAILTSTINAQHGQPPGIDNVLEYEYTLGARDGLSLEIPFGWAQQPGSGMFGGFGDITAGIKHVMFAHFNNSSGPVYSGTGTILSVQAEATLPTGNADKGLGTGQTQFGGYAAFDVVMPAQTFLQLQAGADQPLRTTFEAPPSLYFYGALGKSFEQGMGFGRQWSPMLEATANRDLQRGADTEWSLIPQFQVTLSARQHVRAALGYVVPLNDTATRPRQIMLYVLWDWFDGGLLEGW